MKQPFLEKQKFTQWWIWILLISTTLIPIYGIYQQIFQGEPFGDKPASNLELIGVVVLMGVLLGFFWSIQLTTEINEEGIRVKFFPFTNRFIKWADIQSAQVVNYGFVGGWGIRLGTKYGTVYNTSGNTGLALTLKNGKKLCIGTLKEEELKNVINSLIKDRIGR